VSDDKEDIERLRAALGRVERTQALPTAHAIAKVALRGFGGSSAALEDTLDALADEVEISNDLRLQVEMLGAETARALTLLADIKSWDCEADQCLSLPLELRQRIQTALAGEEATALEELALVRKAPMW